MEEHNLETNLDTCMKFRIMASSNGKNRALTMDLVALLFMLKGKGVWEQQGARMYGLNSSGLLLSSQPQTVSHDPHVYLGKSQCKVKVPVTMKTSCEHRK